MGQVLKNVHFKISNSIYYVNLQDNSEQEGEFDTVLIATGRKALTSELKVINAGVKVIPENLKIDAIHEQTNIPNIYAVGDVLHVRTVLLCQQLTN